MTVQRLKICVPLWLLWLLLIGAAVHGQEEKGSIKMPCTVEAFYATDIISRLDGYVGKVNVDLGDLVKKGEVLLELDAPEIKAAVVQKKMLVKKAIADVSASAAEVESVNARAASLEARKSLRASELSRIKGLVSSGVVTRAKRSEAEYAFDSVISDRHRITADVKAAEAKLVAAEAAVAVAQADLAHAQAMANYLAIKAPFNGVVTKRNVDPGAYVRPPGGNAPMPLISLEQIDKVRVVVMVPASSANGIATGKRVTITGIRGQDTRIEGTVSRMGSGFEKGSRTMRVEVELENKPAANGQRPLRSGDYGSAEIRIN